MFKTKTVSQSQIEEKWIQVDATGKRLGVLASKVAEILMDKGNPSMRDYLVPKVKVIVLNAEKLDIPERKKVNKLYTTYSGFPSGLKTYTLGELYAKFPERVVEKAIKRMLPKNRRGREIFRNLNVYSGDAHKHEAQKPQVVDISKIKY